MAELDPALKTALEQRHVIFFGAVELLLPDRAVRLIDGSGELMIDGEKYSGRDPEWGVIESIKGLADSLDGKSPQVTLGFIPASSLALAKMLNPALQGCAVTIMAGCVAPLTGQVIGEPYIIFTGEIDVPTPKWTGSVKRCDITANGIGERLFAQEEGRRLSSSFHQKVWPGELGLDFVTDVESWVPWGQELKVPAADIRSNLIPGGGIASGGGSGGGGWGSLLRAMQAV